jgi:hypothetical protein
MKAPLLLALAVAFSATTASAGSLVVPGFGNSLPIPLPGLSANISSRKGFGSNSVTKEGIEYGTLRKTIKLPRALANDLADALGEKLGVNLKKNSEDRTGSRTTVGPVVLNTVNGPVLANISVSRAGKITLRALSKKQLKSFTEGK